MLTQLVHTPSLLLQLGKLRQSSHMDVTKCVSADLYLERDCSPAQAHCQNSHSFLFSCLPPIPKHSPAWHGTISCEG